MLKTSVTIHEIINMIKVIDGRSIVNIEGISVKVIKKVKRGHLTDLGMKDAYLKNVIDLTALVGIYCILTGVGANNKKIIIKNCFAFTKYDN